MEKKKVNLTSDKGWIGGYGQSVQANPLVVVHSVIGSTGQRLVSQDWQISPAPRMAWQRGVEKHGL